MKQAAHAADQPEDKRTPFQKFQSLTQRILTMPKSELVKDAPKNKPSAKKK